jgi:soluble lytic murein transglycosylase-like protein
LSRKLLASAFAAGVLSAPVAIAVADENTTEADAAPAPAAPQVNLSEQQRTHVNHKRAAARGEVRRQARAARKARARKRARKARQRAGTPPPHLQAIAACESGGNPAAIGGGGAYRGKYQFDYGTWASVGGSGDPAAAPEAEQDRRAAMLYARAGSTPWPVCGR